MRLKRDSIVFAVKIFSLIFILVAGYIKKETTFSSGQKGEVDLIIKSNDKKLDFTLEVQSISTHVHT